MPCLYAHSRVADRALELFRAEGSLCQGEAHLAAALEAEAKVYRLGAQGPDLFYFHPDWPWIMDQQLTDLAILLHTSHTGRFLAAMVAEAEGAAAERFGVLVAYLCGYICHYYSDAAVHPFVIYRTGDLTDHGPRGSTAIRDHARLETAIDALLIEEELGRRPAELDASSLVGADAAQVSSIAQLYATAVAKVYGRAIPPVRVGLSIDAMLRIGAILLDPEHPHVQLLTRIAPLIDPAGVTGAAVYPRRAARDRDYLNLRRRPWHPPWDCRARSTETVPALLERAARSSAEAMSDVQRILWHGEEPGVLTARLGNRSMLTGLECGTPAEGVSFDPIFKRTRRSRPIN